MVKTVSGSVASWPATGNVTTQPLPVLLPERPTHVDDETKEVTVNWEPNPESHQDQYKVGHDDDMSVRAIHATFAVPCLCSYVCNSFLNYLCNYERPSIELLLLVSPYFAIEGLGVKCLL